MTTRWLVAALLLAACSETPGVPAAARPAGTVAAGTGGSGGSGASTDGSGPARGGTGGATAMDAADATVVGTADAPAAEVTPSTDGLPGRSPDGFAPGDAAAPMRLSSDGFLMRGQELIFPAAACYPRDQSPAFTFSGVPAGTRSLAFTFVDRSNGATKWVVWNIPPATLGLPANLSKSVHPTELPAATQRGSLGRTGYSGPGVSALHTYDFQLYALDVDQLPGTEGASTITIRTMLIPKHLLAQSPIFTAKGQLGGSGQ